MTKSLAKQFEEKVEKVEVILMNSMPLDNSFEWREEVARKIVSILTTAEAEIRADQKEITKAVMTINRQAEYDRIEKSAYERGRAELDGAKEVIEELREELAMTKKKLEQAKADERARVKEWAKEQKKKTIEQINMIHGANMSAACELAYRDALSDLLSFLTKEK